MSATSRFCPISWGQVEGRITHFLGDGAYDGDPTCRLLRIVGPGLKSRNPDAQHTEAMIGVDILNQMFDFGIPITERIE